MSGPLQAVGARHDGAFHPARLERTFERCFADSLRTRLVGGAAEPLYQPSERDGEPSTLYYREDYFASALHEVAHWCVAGPRRRLLVDFGYWYAPDGRNPQQQRAFEDMEYKPQALEWFFSRACGFPFRISTDNLSGTGGEPVDTGDFRQRVVAQARHWQDAGLPARAATFFAALCREFDTAGDPLKLRLTLAGLDG